MSKIEVVFFDLGETLVTSGRQWIAGAKKTVLDLDQLGIRLGVISNTGDLSRQQILQLLPIDLDLGIFESSLVVFSSEVGIEKPDPGIFTLALERTGIEAGKCLFCTEKSRGYARRATDRHEGSQGTTTTRF